MGNRVRRAITLDRESTPDPPDLVTVIHTVEQIGLKRFRTPEGFLLCQDVPIARIGLMMYGPGETPIEVGKDGIAWVTRTAETLFAETCMQSFVGKPVVDEHPPEDVTPKNWRQYAEGIVLNVRQGTGVDADVMLADLLITDEDMIREIEAGKVEVSAGYEADYEQTGPGEGQQADIIGNHVALVQKGRCGPRCAIGDEATINIPTEKEDTNMATQQVQRRAVPKPRRRISQATLDQVAELLEGDNPDASTMDDGELTGKADGGTHIHIHGIGTTQPGSNGAVDVADDGAATGGPTEGVNGTPADKYEARFTSIENGIKELTASVAAMVASAAGQGGSGGTDPATKDAAENDDGKTDDDGNPFAKKDDKEDDKDGKGKTNDSAALQTSYQALIADAEVLVPGFRVSTFDAKAKRATTIDTMCNTRRKALDTCYATQDGKALIESVSGVKTLDMQSLDCAAVGTLFRAAAGAKKLLNNTQATRDASHIAQPNARNGNGNVGYKPPMSLAELNKSNREFYAKKAAARG